MVRISDAVLDVLEDKGITHQQLDEMVSKAAITSLLGANRRYHQWFFVVGAGKNPMVEKMFYVPRNHESVKSWKIHSDCFGWGCQECNWFGAVPAKYPCNQLHEEPD